MEGNRKADKPTSPQPSSADRSSNGRPTIGLLIEGVSGVGGYQTVLWSGIVKASQEQEVNLICFTGGTLGWSPFNEFELHRNAIYDLVSPDNVDGLIISSGSLSGFVSLEEFKDFYSRYRSLPMVSIGLALEGIPSVLVDNEKGLRDAISHLIEVHGYQRIAFIRGPQDHQEADLRYRVYTETLMAHGLDLNPDLVAPGDFLHASGAAAIHSFIEDRKLSPQEDFEAIVAANDNMALGAMQALHERGVHVPHDVAVVGFDDMREAKFATPPLATVRQPICEQGKRAVEMLLALLAGEQVSEQVMLPTELVVRQSCGCHSYVVQQAAVGPVTRTEVPNGHSTGEAFQAILAAQRQDMIANMVQALVGDSDVVSFAAARERVDQLLDGFAADIRDGSSTGFLSMLDEVLRQEVAAGGDVIVWQEALSAMRRDALPYLDGKALSRAEDLWQQARVLIGEISLRVCAYQEMRTDRYAQTVREIGQTIVTVLDVAELMDMMAERLPQLGIPSCYVSLYEGQTTPPPTSRLVMAYDERGRIELEADGRCFPSLKLIPDGMLYRERPYNLVAKPLYFRGNQFGIVLFEVGPPDGTVYEALRGQISSALQSTLLLQKRKQATEETRQRLREQTVLFEASHRLASASLQAEEIAEIAVRLLVEIMDATECSFSLFDPQDGTLQVLADFWIEVGKGEGWAEDEEIFNLSDYPVTARVMETLQPMVMQASDPDVDPAESSYMRENETATLAIFPLAVKGQAIGVMELETREERHYTPEELSVAMILANQTAAALENARLYEAMQKELVERKRAEEALKDAYAEVEKRVKERTVELQQETAERERLQQEIIEAQRQTLKELSTPVIPIMDRTLVMPLVGSIDSMRARDITRALLAGIRQHRAKMVILDITGVPVVDSSVADHLNKTIQAARLKGARTIITGISDAVAEIIVDLGIDWSGVETVSDLQTGLIVALKSMGIKLTK